MTDDIKFRRNGAQRVIDWSDQASTFLTKGEYMIKEFVEKFERNKSKVEVCFREKHPEDYKEVVKNVVSVLADDEYGSIGIDPERIHVIDDGDYQGMLLFVIAETGNPPSDYWYVAVSYGSCSGCDTLQNIRSYSDEKPTDEQVKDYMTLALHIVQGLKKIRDDEC